MNDGGLAGNVEVREGRLEGDFRHDEIAEILA